MEEFIKIHKKLSEIGNSSLYIENASKLFKNVYGYNSLVEYVNYTIEGNDKIEFNYIEITQYDFPCNIQLELSFTCFEELLNTKSA